MDWLVLLFAPIRPFVAHPERAAAMASAFLVIFLVLGWVRRSFPWPLLWATGAWTLYAIWEWLILAEEANIRVDLLLIYPVLVVVTLSSLWLGFRPGTKSNGSK